MRMKSGAEFGGSISEGDIKQAINALATYKGARRTISKGYVESIVLEYEKARNHSLLS